MLLDTRIFYLIVVKHIICMMCGTLAVALVLFFVSLGVVESKDSSSFEGVKLIQNLVNRAKKYPGKPRPVKNDSLPVDLAMQITLTQILDFDTKSGVLTINTWNTYRWRSDLLMWNQECDCKQ